MGPPALKDEVEERKVTGVSFFCDRDQEVQVVLDNLSLGIEGELP